MYSFLLLFILQSYHNHLGLSPIHISATPALPTAIHLLSYGWIPPHNTKVCFFHTSCSLSPTPKSPFPSFCDLYNHVSTTPSYLQFIPTQLTQIWPHKPLFKHISHHFYNVFKIEHPIVWSMNRSIVNNTNHSFFTSFLSNRMVVFLFLRPFSSFPFFNFCTVTSYCTLQYGFPTLQ